METANEITLIYHRTNIDIYQITSSELAERAARSVYQKTNAQIELKEYCFMLLLNHHHDLIGFHKLSEGGITGTVVDLRLAYGTALKSLATSIILVHNHPSGGLIPSEADKLLTTKFKEAGKLLDINLLDHIILTTSHSFSFSDEGLL